MSGAVTAIILSSKDLIHDTAHCSCVLYLSSINCQGTVGSTVIRDGVDAESLVTAVMIIPYSIYLPGDTNIGAASTTGEVRSFTHGDSLVLNILCYAEWFCKGEEKNWNLSYFSEVLKLCTNSSCLLGTKLACENLKKTLQLTTTTTFQSCCYGNNCLFVTLHSSQGVASGVANPNLVSVHLPPTTNVMSPTAIRFPVGQREMGEQLWTVTVHW